MRFEPESLHDANAGLKVARELMEKIKKQFSWISYGDLWTLGGVAAIQVLLLSQLRWAVDNLTHYMSSQEMAGPKIPWRPGRIDGFEKHVTPDGRLPDASQGADHLRNVSSFALDSLIRRIVLMGQYIDFLSHGIQ